MSSFIIRSPYALGDTVLLTAAVRDLHRQFRGQIRVDVRTAFPEVWRHNPYLTPLNEYDSEVNVVDCQFDLVGQSNQVAAHCLHAFFDFFRQYLDEPLQPSEFKGDLHLSRKELRASPPLLKALESDTPFWLIATGGTLDLTAKWWDVRRYQEVVDHFRGKLLFVQVGAARDYHPPLAGALDLRGRTSVRDLIHLVYHARGVVCGVTGLMHLAAAVPLKGKDAFNRPCVVIGGGRESPVWEAYPGHQFLHTVGSLPCCAQGGCWKHRAVPLGDGEVWDEPENLCVDVDGMLPRCMSMITSEDVIRCLDKYVESGNARPLNRREVRGAQRAARRLGQQPPEVFPLNICTARQAAENFIRAIPPYPGGFAGRGIVICAGGVRLFVNAWICINMLRHLGCQLPIQLWFQGESEMDSIMKSLLEPLGVECVDAAPLRQQQGARNLHGWPLKVYALAHSHFEEILMLDADNVPVRNPEYLFDSAQFRKTGAVFWPDYLRMDRDREAWKVFDVPYRDEPEVESGQLLLRKSTCWTALQLALWYNEHSYFYYQFVLGDKETFHLAWRKLKQPYAMPRAPIHTISGTMCQHDFQGRRIFQHRNTPKWTYQEPNLRVKGFLFERECHEFLAQLRARWDGRVSHFLQRPPASTRSRRTARIRIAAYMVSCRERETIQQQTLARLAQTDWGDRPVRVILDEERFRSRVDRITHTAWRMLNEISQTQADYVLYLEDDLLFNHYFRHNLESWPLLANREIALATLYNPGVYELAVDGPHQAVVMDPLRWFGNQAIVLSRAFGEHLLRHWFEGRPEADLKLGHHAAQLKRPVFAHLPSLVQHVGRRSTWGGGFHQARDFDPKWRNPASGRQVDWIRPGSVVTPPGRASRALRTQAK